MGLEEDENYAGKKTSINKSFLIDTIYKTCPASTVEYHPTLAT
jgi:hypothetical protein